MVPRAFCISIINWGDLWSAFNSGIVAQATRSWDRPGLVFVARGIRKFGKTSCQFVSTLKHLEIHKKSDDFTWLCLKMDNLR